MRRSRWFKTVKIIPDEFVKKLNFNYPGLDYDLNEA